MAHISATGRNKVPGTEYNLGAGTSLNAIMEACDAIHQNATASRKRVLVVQIHGGQSGVLAVVSGLAVGAASVCISEEDADGKSQGRVFIQSEATSKTYTTDMVSTIIKREGHQQFNPF
ncbi:6-phosphofructokinase, alpha subunit [Mortierella sp. NVP85]|nr:6-phosphofructokinase, alpha subunit [Mortierella sp. NVP85]